MMRVFLAVYWMLLLILASYDIRQPRIISVKAFSPHKRFAWPQQARRRTVPTLCVSEQSDNNGNTDDTKDSNAGASGGTVWQRIGPPIATLSSPWLTVLAERYQDNSNNWIDYWRIQRASSVIVVVIHRNHYILPAPQFRPGVQRCTLDFVGGRCTSAGDDTSSNSNRELILDTAKRLLVKELGLSKDTIDSFVKLIPLNSNNNSSNNTEGWPVDSSVSNQKLYGVVAIVDDAINLVDQSSSSSSTPALSNDVVLYPVDSVDDLLGDLKCLQCRAILLEWIYRQQHLV